MSRRTERIGKLMQQEIGRLLMTGLSDPRIDTARTSITRVNVQEDLLRAKVYVSVLGTDAEQARTLEALQHAARRIQVMVRDRISIRHMPVLEFLRDERFKGALKTWEIIRQAMDEIRAKEAAGREPAEGPGGQNTEESARQSKSGEEEEDDAKRDDEGQDDEE